LINKTMSTPTNSKISWEKLKTGVKLIALFNFTPDGSNRDQLPLTAGDIIVYQGERDPKGWARGECKGKIGWFPCTYVKKESRKRVASKAGSGTSVSDDFKISNDKIQSVSSSGSFKIPTAPADKGTSNSLSTSPTGLPPNIDVSSRRSAPPGTIAPPLNLPPPPGQVKLPPLNEGNLPGPSPSPSPRSAGPSPRDTIKLPMPPASFLPPPPTDVLTLPPPPKNTTPRDVSPLPETPNTPGSSRKKRKDKEKDKEHDKERKKLKSRENSKGDKDKSVDSSKDKVERKNSGPNNNTISNNTNDELKKSSSGGSVDTRIKSGSVVQTSPSGPNNNIQPETSVSYDSIVDQKGAIKDKMNKFLIERPTLDDIDKQKGGEKKSLDKLLLLFKKKKKGQIKEISGPTGVVHTAGVNRDIFTSVGFAGVKLPPEWEKIINESGIPKAELMEHTDVILDILRSMDEKRRRRIAEMIPDDKEVPTTIDPLVNKKQNVDDIYRVIGHEIGEG
jgi:hypothetical protein